MGRYRECARHASGWNGIRNSNDAPTVIPVFVPVGMRKSLPAPKPTSYLDYFKIGIIIKLALAGAG
jgi:hypothetical protein